MWALWTILLALSFRLITGEDYCSRKSYGKAECIPCSQLCPGIQTPCNVSFAYCPKQCGNTIKASNCPDVCNDNCLGGRCEYKKGRMDLTCSGCRPEFTGKRCKEYCPERCYECHQFNPTCLTCKNNYHNAPNCTEINVTAAVSVVSGLSFTYGTTYNCSKNCISCDDSTGNCKECAKGSYGNSCQFTCTHCNITLCSATSLQQPCLVCTRKLSSLDCNISNAKQNSTENCTTTDCVKLQGSSVILAVTCGFSSALLMTLFIVCILKRKIYDRYDLMCVYRGHRQGRDQYSDGYTYIDDDKNDSLGKSPNRKPMPPPCSPNNYYESIGSQRRQMDDVESGSSLSSIDGTIFGNLFEVNRDHEEIDDHNIGNSNRNRNQNDSKSSDEYDTCTSQYITPN